MDDLVRWLGEQLDEDQRIAEAARGQGEGRWHHETSYPNGYVYDGGVQPVVYDESTPSPEEAEHIAEWDPARALREIDAKRVLLRRANGGVDYPHAHPGEGDVDHLGRHHDDGLLRLLALPYTDRPGYREEWRP